MTEPSGILTVVGIPLYPYGICIAIAVVLACAVACSLFARRFNRPGDGLRLTLYAIPACLLLARLGYLAVRLRFLPVDYVPGFWYALPLGGYSLAGASLGLGLACWLFGKRSRISARVLLDLALPCALIVLAGARLAERFTLDGVGVYIESEALWRFPFAVANPYGEYVLPVFFWEAITAVLIALGLLLRLRKPHTAGDTALTGMLALGLTQVFWESLRGDDFLRFGFVRVNQLWGVLLACIAIGIWLLRGGYRKAVSLAAAAGVLVAVSLLIALEFGLDKSAIPNAILYGAMGATLLALGCVGITLRQAAQRRVVADANG